MNVVTEITVATRQLKKFVDAVARFASRAFVGTSDQGLHIAAIDDARTLLTRLAVPREALGVVMWDNVGIWVRIKQLRAVLDLPEINSEVTMTVLDEDPEVENSKGEIVVNCPGNFLVLMEGTDPDPHYKEYPWRGDVEAQMWGSGLVQMVREVRRAGADVVRLVASPEGLVAEGLRRGGNTDVAARYQIDRRARAIDKPIASQFSVEYLAGIAKSVTRYDKIILKYGDDWPLQIDIRGEEMEISYLLAPALLE